MTQIPPAGMSQVIPYLFYDDVPRAIAWLERAFGFEKVMMVPTGNGRHHGEMRCGAGVIMMGTASNDFSCQTPHAAKARTHGTFIYLDQVDAHFARAKDAGAEIVNPPKDEDYGRTYWARDLDGHDWFFTRPPA